MAKGKATATQNKYSVILPTYNERQNLPVLVQMLYDVFTREYVCLTNAFLALRLLLRKHWDFDSKC